jgi:alpha-pyrone synthase
MYVTTDEMQTWSQGGGGQTLGLVQMPPAPPTTVAVIESIATGAPSRVVDQSEAADEVAALFSNPDQQERISRLYRKTMIGTRRMAVDPLDPEFDALRREAGTIRDRMNLFYQHAVPLAVDVAGRALAPIEDPATEIGLLVFVTSTGFHRSGRRCGGRQATRPVAVGFACGGELHGMCGRDERHPHCHGLRSCQPR